MKGLIDGEQRLPQRRAWKSDLILGAFAVVLVLNLLYHGNPLKSALEDEPKIFTCHAPQPHLLNTHEIDRTVFDSDIKWAKKLLKGVVKGDNGYGDPADSVTLSIFLPQGEPIVEIGFGKVRANESESRVPDGDSIYRMASISKMFTTAEIMLLKQQGHLDLDQDVSTILSDFKPSTAGWTGYEEQRIVTVRQLLSHTSGILRDPMYETVWPPIPGADDNSTKPEPLNTRADMMAKLHNIPPVMPGFGTPVYSNIGFSVAGFVAQEIGQTKYEELLDRDIFKPLGMESASFKRQPNLLDHVIVPSEPLSIWADTEMGDSNPAGGLYCSAADLRRFGQDLLGFGKSANARTDSQQPIFTKLTTREWLRPVHVFDDNLVSIGLNWEIYTVPVGARRMSIYSKGGTLPGFHTLFGIDPEREFGYALLISGEPSSNTDLAIRIMRRFAKTLDKARQKILSKEFAGVYIHDADNMIKLDVVDGGMAVTKAVIEGRDLFEELHLGQGEGDYAALWPTGEETAWRVAIGRPPAHPYQGCMFKFASIDPAFAKGFPVDLMIIDSGKLVYPSVNRTFFRQ